MDEVYSLDLGEGDSVALTLLPADEVGPASIELAVVGEGRFGVYVPMTLEQADQLHLNLTRLLSGVNHV